MHEILRLLLKGIIVQGEISNMPHELCWNFHHDIVNFGIIIHMESLDIGKLGRVLRYYLEYGPSVREVSQFKQSCLLQEADQSFQV